jgi:glucose/arabinose dehydrogenase
MLRARVCLLLACLLTCLLATTRADAQVVPDDFAAQIQAQGLAAPTAFQFMPDGRLLFTEQFTGRVRLWRGPFNVQSNPVLHVPDVAVGGERGLLGVALDPSYPARPYLYVHYTAAAPNHIRIARYTLSGNLSGTLDTDLTADSLSRYDLIDDIPDNAPNHNGGTVRFGVDGLLYVSLGDDAQSCAAQDTTALQGKILRLRVDALPDGPGRAFRAQITPFDNPFVSRPDSNARLVAALGLRNPFRIQPDRVRGWLVIGDVGENAREEMDVMVLHLPSPRPAQPELGADFGWPFREGTIAGPGVGVCGTPPLGLAEPEFDYDRSQQNGAAIIVAGAYWATGTGLYDFPAEYAGNIFANDYYSGTLYRLVPLGNAWAPAPAVPGQPAPGAWGTGFFGISDWAVGRDGALWYCKQATGLSPNSGEIDRIICTTTPPPPPPPAPLALGVHPSPAVGTATFTLALDGITTSATLTLHDLSGRLVRRWRDDEFQRNPNTGLEVTWDGHDDDGHAARPGLYLVRLESGGQEKSVRFAFLR